MKTDSAQYYPPEIESWWVHRVCSYYKIEDENTALAKIRDNVQSLSDHFTLNRDELGIDYGRKEYFLLAYGIFFFPQTWARVRYALCELLDLYEFKMSRKGPIKILDIGSGTGAAFLSTVQLLRARGINNPIHVDIIDHSRNSLEIAKNILNNNRFLFGEVKLQTKVEDCSLFIDKKEKNFEEYHIVMASFSINEIMVQLDFKKQNDLISKLQNKCRPKGLLLIMEPALKETAERLQTIRDHRLKEGESFSWGPYLSDKKCPFLEKGKFWNHEVRIWHPPKSLRTVNTKLWRKVRELKFSYVAFSKLQSLEFEISNSLFRIVSPVTKKKGKFMLFGVSSAGNHCSYDCQTRNMNSDEKKEFESFERGDILSIQGMQNLGQENCFRIPGLKSISVLSKIR